MRRERFQVTIIGGPSGEFCLVRGKEPAIARTGKSRNIFHNIYTSTCTFTIYVKQEHGHVRAFINQLINSNKEVEFFVTVTQYGRTVFAGAIVSNNTTLVEQSWPEFEFQIKAIDGISLLKDIPYTDTSGDPFDGSDPQSIHDHIAQCFALMPTVGLHSTIAMNHDWASNYSDDLSEHYVDHEIFHEKSETTGAGVIPLKAWDVLDYICNTFHWRIVYSRGIYYIENMPKRVQTTNVIYDYYDMSMNPKGGPGFYIPIIVGCRDDQPTQLVETGSKTLWGPLKESETVYHFRGFVGNFGDRDTKFDVVVDGAADCHSDLGLIPVPDAEVRLRISGTLEWVIDGTVPEFELLGIRILWYLTIQIGDQYYKREFKGDLPQYYDFQFANEEWSATPGEYLIYDGAKGPVLKDNKKFSMPFEVETLYIPETVDGEQISLCLRMEAIDQDDNTITALGFTANGYWYDQNIQIIGGQEANKIEDSYISTTILGDQSNREKVSVDLIFGDGPNETTPSAIKVGTARDSTFEWTSGTVSGTYTIQELSARSRMALGQNKVVFLEGTLCGLISSAADILYEFTKYVPLTYTWYTGKDEISGEWAHIRLGSGAGAQAMPAALREGMPTVAQSVIPLDWGLIGDKYVAIGEQETARSPGTPDGGVVLPELVAEYRIWGSGQSQIDLAALTDPAPPIYNPSTWNTKFYASLVTVYRNGQLQIYDPPNTIFNSWTASGSGRYINLAEAMTTEDYLQIFIKFILT